MSLTAFYYYYKYLRTNKGTCFTSWKSQTNKGTRKCIDIDIYICLQFIIKKIQTTQNKTIQLRAPKKKLYCHVVRICLRLPWCGHSPSWCSNKMAAYTEGFASAKVLLTDSQSKQCTKAVWARHLYLLCQKRQHHPTAPTSIINGKSWKTHQPTPPIYPWQSIRGPLQLPFSIPRSHRRGRRRHDGHLLIGIAQVATDAFVSHGVETCHRARKRTGAG